MRRRIDSAVEVVAQTGRLRIHPDDAAPFFTEPWHDFLADGCRGVRGSLVHRPTDVRGSLVHRPTDLITMPMCTYEESAHER